MKFKTIAVGSLIALGTSFGGSAMADGVGKYSVTSTNDTFTSTGTIRSSATATGGIAMALAGQRVNAPLLAVSFDYKSSGNRYTQTGTIQADAKATGGAAYSIAAQEINR